MIKYISCDIVFQEVPDEVTIAFTLSNCPNNCKGCHSPQLRGDIGKELTEGLLVEEVKKYDSAITCVCFMGGDSNVDDVQKLAQFVRESLFLKTAWYSGREKMPPNKNYFDYIKLGSYIEKYGGLSNRSTNQRMYKINSTRTAEDITSRFWSKGLG